MLFASPLPTHTTSPFDGAAATAPMEPTPIESEIGVHAMPPLVVFQIPPVATATYIALPRRPPRKERGASMTEMSAIRPLIEAGPMARKVSGRTSMESASVACADRAAGHTAATATASVARGRSGRQVNR